MNLLKNTKHPLATFAVAVAFAVFGAMFITVSSADTLAVSSESENGTLATNAAIVNDTGASGGKAVRFKEVSTEGGTETITNGKQITPTNTGYLAWTGPSGEKCTDSNIRVYTAEVMASSIGSSATCVYFKGGIIINAPITLNACKVDGVINTTYSYHKTTINYCTIVSPSPQDWALGPGNFTAIRSQLTGNSDGVRYAGSTNDTLIENYIRTKTQNINDHNDGVQMYGSTGGGTLLRNMIDSRPVAGGNGNAALFIADNSTGTYEIRDNYMVGGTQSIRLHENGYYKLTGNIVEKGSYSYAPVNTANSRAGAFLEWANNTLSDGTVLTQ